MKALYTAPALLLVGVLGVGAIGASSQSASSAATAAAAACTWLDPQPERIALTMEQLTDEPVDADHWDTWVARTQDLSTSDYTASTGDDRHQLLVTAATLTLNSDLDPDITTPAIIWWAGAMPTDDTDEAWTTVTVPGWDGTLETYIGAYANAYATDPDVLAAVEAAGLSLACSNPALAASCPQPYDPASALAATRLLESGGNYTDNHDLVVTDDDDPPTGAYHYTRADWANYGGYLDAWQAPADVQDARALADITAIVNTLGDPAWIPVAWTAGLDIAQRIHDGQLPTTYTPVPGQPSASTTRVRWLQLYVEALARNNITANTCPTGATAVIAWAETQIGAPYYSVPTYRFGIPWPGGERCVVRGTVPFTTCWNYPAGTIGYDCSGFVIAAWQHGGLDFGQLGLHSSQQFLTNLIPDADPNALQPGDLAVYSRVNGIGHIVLIHHIDPDGTVRTIESSGDVGVHIGILNWKRVTALKHPSVAPPPSPEPQPIVDDGIITWKPGEPHTVTVGDGTSRPYTGWASNIPVDHYDRGGHPVPVLVHPAGHPEIELAPVTAQRMRAWETAYGSKFIFSGSPAAYRAFPASGVGYSRYTKQWRLVHYTGHFSGEAIDLHLTAMNIDPYKPLTDPRRQRWEALKRTAEAAGWECWNPTDEPWHWSVNGRH